MLSCVLVLCVAGEGGERGGSGACTGVSPEAPAAAAACRCGRSDTTTRAFAHRAAHAAAAAAGTSGAEASSSGHRQGGPTFAGQACAGLRGSPHCALQCDAMLCHSRKPHHHISRAMFEQHIGLEYTLGDRAVLFATAAMAPCGHHVCCRTWWARSGGGCTVGRVHICPRHCV